METEAPISSSPPVPSGPPLDPREVLQKILDGLGLQTKVEVFTMDGSTLLHIATAEPGRLIGKHGQTLSQLQFLVNRILQRASAEAPRVTVDCERYRERQRDDTLKKVLEAADNVRRWGDAVKIGPFNAFDRRVIHLHMEKDRELEAISEGDGDEAGMKKMIIRVREKPWDSHKLMKIEDLEQVDWLEPWCATEPGLESQLTREIGPKHPLYEQRAIAVARRQDCDDVLFFLPDSASPSAVVHLTWARERGDNPQWPSTEFYSSLQDWVEKRMKLDADFTAEG